MTDRHSVTPYPLRLSADLRSALDEAAKAGGRSLHAEIIGRLERTFEEDRLGLSEDTLDAIGLHAVLTLNVVPALGVRGLSAEQRQALDALLEVSKRLAVRFGRRSER